MRKLASYVLLSFLSFGVFTTLFHTVANAQTTDFIIGPSTFPSKVPVLPTPTIKKTADSAIGGSASGRKPSTVKFALQSVTLPTPTDEPKQEEPTPTPEKKVEKTAPKEEPAKATLTPEPTEEPTPTATPAPQPVAGPAELEAFFEKYASEYGVDKEDLKRIAKCEAGFNSQADTGLYAGMYQFHAQTWSSTRNAMGLDPNPDLRKNAEESIRTAAYKIKNGGRGSWPNC